MALEVRDPTDGAVLDRLADAQEVAVAATIVEDGE
jgi:hypothetical protein